MKIQDLNYLECLTQTSSSIFGGQWIPSDDVLDNLRREFYDENDRVTVGNYVEIRLRDGQTILILADVDIGDVDVS